MTAATMIASQPATLKSRNARREGRGRILIAEGLDISTAGAVRYVWHFATPLKHASHYIGTTINLQKRIEQHASGQGAKLMDAVLSQGIDAILVSIEQGHYSLENEAKRQHNGPAFCPVCHEQWLARRREAARARRAAKRAN